MGIIKQGILGGFSGKVGSVVGTSWKGRAVMKALPLSVANPQTFEQTENRTQFKGVVQFASIINASMIIPLMNRFAGNVSGNNKFVSLNKNYFDADGLDDSELLNFGTGKLGDTPITVFERNAGFQSFNFQWSNVLDNPYKANIDKAYVMVVDGVTKKPVAYGDYGNSRYEAVTNPVSLEPIVEGRTYYGYLVFLRQDGTQVGSTAYATVVASA